MGENEYLTEVIITSKSGVMGPYLNLVGAWSLGRVWDSSETRKVALFESRWILDGLSLLWATKVLPSDDEILGAVVEWFWFQNFHVPVSASSAKLHLTSKWTYTNTEYGPKCAVAYPDIWAKGQNTWQSLLPQTNSLRLSLLRIPGPCEPEAA